MTLAKAAVTGIVYKEPKTGFTQNNVAVSSFVMNIGETEEILLFHGIVDDVSISADKSHKELKCYDELKTKGNKDIAEWYKALTFPITIKQFRDSLFTYVGITQEATILPNDDIVIDKYIRNLVRCGVFGNIEGDIILTLADAEVLKAYLDTCNSQHQRSGQDYSYKD